MRIVNYAKQYIKKCLRTKGYDLSTYDISHDEYLLLAQAVKNFSIDVIFDVGANRGQFASEIRRNGYSGKIVSFEPIQSQYDQLCSNSQSDTNWDVFPRCAIGNENSNIEINISENYGSSSILNISKIHTDAAPNSGYIRSETVPLYTMDKIISEHYSSLKNGLLKIDVQGYEWFVLEGAVESMHAFKGIVCELSLVELYEGAKPWSEIVNKIESLGFTLWSIQPAFADANTGRLLQVDASFFRA